MTNRLVSDKCRHKSVASPRTLALQSPCPQMLPTETLTSIWRSPFSCRCCRNSAPCCCERLFRRWQSPVRPTETQALPTGWLGSWRL